MSEVILAILVKQLKRPAREVLPEAGVVVPDN